jgi:hypothetical protein
MQLKHTGLCILLVDAFSLTRDAAKTGDLIKVDLKSTEKDDFIRLEDLNGLYVGIISSVNKPKLYPEKYFVPLYESNPLVALVLLE